MDQIDRMMQMVPSDWWKVTDYMDSIEVEDQPTNVLIEVADLMRKRRWKLYRDLKKDLISPSPSASETTISESEKDD